ncbi:MAG: hypothetical protein OIF57_16775 [Marinobacterium sp.]|nr:hypothetical protein [Marinobacterium sp.]
MLLLRIRQSGIRQSGRRAFDGAIMASPTAALGKAGVKFGKASDQPLSACLH